MKTEWDLSPLLEKDIDAQLKRVSEESKELIDNFVKKWKNDCSYLIDPKKLKQALDEKESLSENLPLNNISFGLSLLRETNQSDPKIIGLCNKLESIEINLQNELEFFSVNISKIPKEQQGTFLESLELKEYKHSLERVFIYAPHILSENEEKIMNLKHKISYDNWVNMLEELLSKEEEMVFTGEKQEKKNFAEIFNLIDNKDKKIRDSAAKALNNILEKHKDVALKEINSVLENKKVNMEIRKYSLPEQERILSDDVDLEFVESLRKQVTNRFDLSKRYYSLKAKLMGIEKLKYHERNVPYGEIKENYSLEQAIKKVTEMMTSFDPQTGEIANKFFENGQVDVYPKKGKNSGAFCAARYKNQPGYVLLNYDNSFREVQIMAHELGHAINHELMKIQKTCYYGISLATAEVASTFFENMTTESLIEKADKKTKLAIMMADLNNLTSTIFRQIACYNFEKDLHEAFTREGYVSQEKIQELFLKNMKNYMGEAVEQSKGCENWWIYWSHIRNYFYVYSYSSGLLISKFLQKEYSKNASFSNKIKEFLSAGSSKSPREIFKDLGITINEEFWEQGLKQIEYKLNETEQLAKELKLI